MQRPAHSGQLVENDADPESQGTRAQSKLDKQARIVAAARLTFAEKGFAAATTQEIAERAGVAAGTIFRYAKSKEELLVQAFLGEIADTGRKIDSTLDTGAPILDQLMHVFGGLIAYHRTLGQDLSAALLKELVYGRSSFWGRGEPDAHLIEGMVIEILERGKTCRYLRGNLSAEEAANMLFSIFHWQLSHWALGRIPVETLTSRLRYSQGLCLSGIGR